MNDPGFCPQPRLVVAQGRGSDAGRNAADRIATDRTGGDGTRHRHGGRTRGRCGDAAWSRSGRRCASGGAWGTAPRRADGHRRRAACRPTRRRPARTAAPARRARDDRACAACTGPMCRRSRASTPGSFASFPSGRAACQWRVNLPTSASGGTASTVSRCSRCCSPVTIIGDVVIAHLGSGCSVTAVGADGRPRHNTMSLTPTAGMMSATRTGDLDPEIPLYLIDQHGYTADRLRELFTRDSGLAGIAAAGATFAISSLSTIPTRRWRWTCSCRAQRWRSRRARPRSSVGRRWCSPAESANMPRRCATASARGRVAMVSISWSSRPTRSGSWMAARPHCARVGAAIELPARSRDRAGSSVGRGISSGVGRRRRNGLGMVVEQFGRRLHPA